MSRRQVSFRVTFVTLRRGFSTVDPRSERAARRSHNCMAVGQDCRVASRTVGATSWAGSPRPAGAGPTPLSSCRCRCHSQNLPLRRRSPHRSVVPWGPPGRDRRSRECRCGGPRPRAPDGFSYVPWPYSTFKGPYLHQFQIMAPEWLWAFVFSPRGKSRYLSAPRCDGVWSSGRGGRP